MSMYTTIPKMSKQTSKILKTNFKNKSQKNQK